jgi:hypothetical protein
MLMGDQESDISFRWEGPSNIQRRTVELLEGEEWRRRVVGRGRWWRRLVGKGRRQRLVGKGQRRHVMGRGGGRCAWWGGGIAWAGRRLFCILERERRETMAQGILFFSAN